LWFVQGSRVCCLLRDEHSTAWPNPSLLPQLSQSNPGLLVHSVPKHLKAGPGKTKQDKGSSTPPRCRRLASLTHVPRCKQCRVRTRNKAALLSSG
jgi:hypothetical protein